jgi:myo-inositol 2-dehydrogenase/D-chiro-inositol 1-dehydrogenase
MSRQKSTRRNFLKTTAGLAAAGATAPYFFSGAQAGEEESANDRLTVAAIGCGGRGSGIGHQAGGLGNMVACCDVDSDRAAKFAKKYEDRCQTYGDYRQVLDRKDVEAVTIGTPDHWHTKIAVEAMQAGKDVYCEKPLTLTIAESKLICDVTKETGRVFQVGTQQRSEYDQVFLKAVAIARSGRLGGKLHALSSVGGAQSGGPFPTAEAPENLNWDLWLGQAPKVDYCEKRVHYQFRWWFEYSGGQVTDWGVHHTDIAVWALGGEKTGAVEIEGKGEFPVGAEGVLEMLAGEKPAVEPNHYNVARQFDCDMKLANGNTIKLLSGPNELIIKGELGKIRVNRRGLTGKPIEEMSDADRQGLDEEVVKLYKGRKPDGHMKNFFNCIKDRSLPISDVHTHTKSVNACHMANNALLLGRKIRWDPAKYDFIDDPQASSLMSRKQREPYTIKV